MLVPKVVAVEQNGLDQDFGVKEMQLARMAATEADAKQQGGGRAAAAAAGSGDGRGGAGRAVMQMSAVYERIVRAAVIEASRPAMVSVADRRFKLVRPSANLQASVTSLMTSLMTPPSKGRVRAPLRTCSKTGR